MKSLKMALSSHIIIHVRRALHVGWLPNGIASKCRSEIERCIQMSGKGDGRVCAYNYIDPIYTDAHIYLLFPLIQSKYTIDLFSCHANIIFQQQQKSRCSYCLRSFGFNACHVFSMQRVTVQGSIVGVLAVFFPLSSSIDKLTMNATRAWLSLHQLYPIPYLRGQCSLECRSAHMHLKLNEDSLAYL